MRKLSEIVIELVSCSWYLYSVHILFSYYSISCYICVDMVLLQKHSPHFFIYWQTVNVTFLNSASFQFHQLSMSTLTALLLMLKQLYTMKLSLCVTRYSVNVRYHCLMLMDLLLALRYNLSAVMMRVTGQWKPQIIHENVTEVVPTLILCSWSPTSLSLHK